MKQKTEFSRFRASVCTHHLQLLERVSNLIFGEKKLLFCLGIISVTSALLLLFVLVWFALTVTCELETDCSLSFSFISEQNSGFEIKLQPEQTNTRGHKTPPHRPSQHKDTRRHSLQKTENRPVSVPRTSCSFHWIHPKLIPETEQIKAPGCRRWPYRTSRGETPTDPFMETNITTEPGGGGAGRAGDQISSPVRVHSHTLTSTTHLWWEQTVFNFSFTVHRTKRVVQRFKT